MFNYRGLVLKKGDIIIGTAFAVLSVLITMSSYDLGIWKLGKPGPGLMPFGLGIILFSCSIAILILSIRNTENAKKEGEGVWSQVDFSRVASVSGCLISFFFF